MLRDAESFIADIFGVCRKKVGERGWCVVVVLSEELVRLGFDVEMVGFQLGRESGIEGE
ncbi:hypothetical protein A2U01_0010152, partial [Trifolium medium]|nr:hypothetical protein [Trifolium medium]